MDKNQSMVPMNGAQVSDQSIQATRGFGTDQLTTIKETSAMAVAATQRAVVEARYVMALQRPRDFTLVREKVINACKRGGFARTARYSKPVGREKVEGWTIRFAEECIRSMGNLLPEVMTVYDDAKQRIIRVTLTDLEANLAYTKDVVVQKTVERSSTNGYEVLGQRTNKKGEPVYIVRATDDDLMNKENSLVSKTLRNHALRLMPGDILDDCLDQVRETLRGQQKEDPAAYRKRIVDGFAKLNITAAQLADFLGHAVDKATFDELEELRHLGNGIRDGEANWAEALRERIDARKAETGEVPDADTAAAPKTTADLAARDKKQKQQKKPAPAAKPEPAGAQVVDVEAGLKKAATEPKRIKVKGPDGEDITPPAETSPAADLPIFDDDEPEPPLPPEDEDTGDLFGNDK